MTSSPNTIDTDRKQEFKRVKSRRNSELSLYVGLFYEVSVKSLPAGLMTYESESREELSNLLQVAWTHPQNYEPGGIYRDRALWTLLPVNDEENNYVFKVLSVPDGILTYSHGLSWGGRYMELDLKHPNYYKPGGTMHTSGMWHFESSEISNHFVIRNSDPRRQPNFVTFSNEVSQDGQLMQIGTKDLSDYEPNGIFRLDALWNWKPADFVLSATVSEFKLKIPTVTELLELASLSRIMEETIIVNDTQEPVVKVYEEREWEESFAFCFLSSFKIFQEENFVIDSKSILKHFPIPWDDLEFCKKSNTQWKGVRKRKFVLEKDVEVSPKEGVTVVGYCQWIHDMEIPFQATVTISAVSPVAICTGTDNVLVKEDNVKITNLEIIEYFLKYERFSAKIIPRTKKSPKVGFQDTNVVLCNVSGILKCSFGMETMLNIR